MALAAPPDLTDTAIPVQPLARTYLRGLYIEPHQHVWGQVLYAVSGVMWVETPGEALVVPPQRAVWLPPGVDHGIRVVSDLEMRNIYLRPAIASTLENSVQVLEVVSQSPEQIKVRLKAAANAQPGARAVSVGTLKGPSLSVYSKIASVKVVPEFSVARIGEGGGSTPKVQGRFDAEAWGKGADGKPYRIGVFPAQWKVEAFDDRAREDEDVKFAGTMQADTGVFTPGDAGPNPARKMSTNNAGNLKVIAAVDDAGKSLTGEGDLIVTVQRWNNPPIP